MRPEENFCCHKMKKVVSHRKHLLSLCKCAMFVVDIFHHFDSFFSSGLLFIQKINNFSLTVCYHVEEVRRRMGFCAFS